LTRSPALHGEPEVEKRRHHCVRRINHQGFKIYGRPAQGRACRRVIAHTGSGHDFMHQGIRPAGGAARRHINGGRAAFHRQRRRAGRQRSKPRLHIRNQCFRPFLMAHGGGHLAHVGAHRRQSVRIAQVHHRHAKPRQRLLQPQAAAPGPHHHIWPDGQHRFQTIGYLRQAPRRHAQVRSFAFGIHAQPRNLLTVSEGQNILVGAVIQ
jgi:hypothetical protein